MTISKSRAERLPRILRYFWLVSLVIAVAVWLALPTSAQQQTDILEALRSHTESCKAAHNSCCGSCCDSGPRCPAGYSVYDDYCLPDCPPGQNRYPGYPGYCSPPCHHGCPEGYEPVPLPQCPDGYYRNLRNPDECLPYRDPVDSNCGEGMAYSHETGRCSPVCPEGTYLNGQGLCESYYTRDCPADWLRNPRTGACVPPGDWPEDYRWICMPLCPQGYTRDIYHPTRCIPPEERCDQGFETFRDQCVPTCEPGTQRNRHGYCVPPRCEDGIYPDLRGRCRQPECPEGYTSIRGQCERIPQDEPDCQEGTRLNRQTGQCERIPQDPKCKKGFTYNTRTKRCDPPPRQPPRVEKQCPEGFFKTREGRCIRIEQEEPDVPELRQPTLCRQGMVYSKRLQRCVRVRVEQPEPEFDPEPNNELPNLRLNKPIRLPTFDQQKCKEGTAPDENGRCMPVQ